MWGGERGPTFSRGRGTVWGVQYEQHEEETGNSVGIVKGVVLGREEKKCGQGNRSSGGRRRETVWGREKYAHK